MTAPVLICGHPHGLSGRLQTALQRVGREAMVVSAADAAADGPPAGALVVLPGDTATRAGSKELDALRAMVRAARRRGVARIVLWGSAGVYVGPGGGSPRREDHELDGAAAATLIERAVTETAGDEVAVYVFRAVAVVGLEDDWVARAARCRALPALSSAVIQVLHADDAVDVLARAVDGGHPGTYNVAGDGLLRWPHALRGLDVPAVACPRSLARGWLQRSLAAPELVKQLAEGIVVDTARLKTHFGHRPRRAAREALAAARDAASRHNPADGSG